jgi:siroheme synthase-like protein
MSAWSETRTDQSAANAGAADWRDTPAAAAILRGVAARRAPLYPVALRLAGRLAVVVGGGAVAHRKAAELLAAGAWVRVVAPDWPADFRPLEEEHGALLERVTRPFEAADADGAAIVVAATDDPAAQRAAARAAADRNLFCNVVDVTDLCTFHVPAVLRRGALSVSVATDGLFPLLAVALRDRLARIVGAAFGAALERLAPARARVRAAHPDDPAARAHALRALLTDAAVDDLLAGRFDEFAARVVAWESAHPAAAARAGGEA